MIKEMSKEKLNNLRLREIPYNYTSFSDRDIVVRLLGEDAWNVLEELRGDGRPGRSARMLYEVLGDIWVIQRNPYLQEDMLFNQKRRGLLVGALYHRIRSMQQQITKLDPQSAEKVEFLVQKALIVIEKFKSSFERSWDLRRLVLKRLKKYTKSQNIRFDSFSRASHVTDATDWRVEYPFAVVYPDREEEVSGIVQACIEMNFTIIARGGGTGYTGGAVPLHPRTIIINTEKLNRISDVEFRALDGLEGKHATIFAGAGAVNKQVAEKAASEGWVFSVDPNSNYACTIGGNIAENAGGKKAVLWGTTADNVYWYRMVDPNGDWIEVTRVNHNLGKIHLQEDVVFEAVWKKGGSAPGKAAEIRRRTYRIKGSTIRKPGLGKDVTNKFFGGVPGLQKEGCDGIITSARFIVHKMPAFTQTVCLEFYGAASNAGPAIYQISQLFESQPEGVMLAGLEHLDDRYLHAINYAPKSGRGIYPKMVIVGDIIGSSEESISKYVEEVRKIALSGNGDTYVAKTPEARYQFWAERSKTSAISKHTNAFKLNEDVVIPLDKIGDYTNAVERFNICCSIENKLDMIRETKCYLDGPLSLGKLAVSSGGYTEKELLSQKVPLGLVLLDKVEAEWTYILHHLDEDAKQAVERLEELGRKRSERLPKDLGGLTLLDLVQNHLIRVSWKQEVLKELNDIFAGDSFENVRNEIFRIHARVLRERVFIALHMHAGDGNVHTNIPVNSDNVKMLRKANEGVAYVMDVAKKLGGAISGEHGIGMTKIDFVSKGEFDEFYDYLDKTDPHGRFNKGKLRPQANLSIAYTPSFNLLGHESLIMQKSEARLISEEIKTCLRCGKCKPVCSTHVPNANLLYSPRNKVIATSLLLEAFLYEEQTRRGVSLKHYADFEDVSDHCTICQKCQKPCPVKIDFGRVTMLMRDMLHAKHKERFHPAKAAGLKFLELENPLAVRAARKGLIEYGFQAERAASDMLKIASARSARHPGFSTGRPSVREEVIHLVNRKLPKDYVGTTARKLLDIEDAKFIPVIKNKELAASDQPRESVFYFPGCGNEKLFSQVSIAVLGMLYDLGVQVILPPGYRCCGHPQKGNGLKDKGDEIITRNRVLFHRVANTMNYASISTVLVSCGTCLHQLREYNFESIFPGCRVMDIHDYLLSKGMSVKGAYNTRYIYHDPCHTPLKEGVPIETVNALIHPKDGSSVVLSERCCGESGTFAIARPDIASQVRFAKEQSLRGAAAKLKAGDFSGTTKVLTTCPGCLQGMSRYSDAIKSQAEFLIVEMMRSRYGDGWLHETLNKLRDGAIEKVLL